MIRLLRRILPAIVLGLAAGSAQAGACGYERCWGAVAIGPNGAYGFAHSWSNETDAVNTALQGCNGNCDVVRSFYNSCAAMAQSSNGGWGWAYAGSRDVAEQNALSYCRDYGPNCQVRVWSCSP